MYPIPPFAGFTQFTPTMPKFYWDIYDKEQMIKQICKMVHKVCEYAQEIGITVNDYAEIVTNLESQFEQFKESGFFDYYAAQINQWIQDNMERIIGEAIKMVFFGLTKDGYFCAYVPKSWASIFFDTDVNYSSDNYGKLILTY